MSDTPRMKAAQMTAMEHSTGDVWRVGCQLEHELNTANDEIDEKRKDVVWLATEKAKLENRIERLEEELMDTKNKHAVLVADVVLNEDRAERINRLEEAGDYLCAAAAFMGWHDRIETWNKAKDVK